MAKIPSTTLHQIAQEINTGCDCYFNRETHEMISISDFDQFVDEEYIEVFQEDLTKVTSKNSGFIKIEKLTSTESFKMMNNLAEELSDQKLKDALEIILGNRKPFQNFKNKIDDSAFREAWFACQQSETEKIVEKRMKSEK